MHKLKDEEANASATLKYRKAKLLSEGFLVGFEVKRVQIDL